MDIGAAHVFGKATIYPYGSVEIDGSGSLGDMAWQMAGNTGIQAGAISTNGSASPRPERQRIENPRYGHECPVVVKCEGSLTACLCG